MLLFEVFKRDPLSCALGKYNNTHPTDKQILDVVSVYIIHHRNDPNLDSFAQNIQQISENESLAITKVNQIVSAWLILNKNKFSPEEYMDPIKESEQLNVLVSCLRVLDDLKYLNRERFKALLKHARNQSSVLSVFNKLNNAKLLNGDNLDAILKLQSYADIDADAFFNGMLVLIIN